MMAARVGDASKLDLATEAALMLAHVAAARQDAVGMMAFGREVLSFIPPDKRAGQVGRILEGLYRLQPTLDEPDYAAAFSLLAGRARKRALVVVFTDLVDTDTSERLLAHVSSLCPRHLPLLIALRDPDLERLAHCIPASIDETYQRAIAGQVLARREEAILALRHRGAVVVDAPAGALTVAAVNRYLELKRRPEYRLVPMGLSLIPDPSTRHVICSRTRHTAPLAAGMMPRSARAAGIKWWATAGTDCFIFDPDPSTGMSSVHL